ncbi:unnamed protein product [Pelagomonas calceolata]|uniref:RED-like N-terminal domain-containing protein n=1 Tax=Pelagomonas calceolata TaxID=35677 RepID=A0A8J2SW39_9STRA|nr:unnamed protein product [Pelagomonas calceolata]
MDNDAFRKIMATPRPHDGKPAEKFDKKSIRKLVDADLQRSKAGSKKHKREKPAKEKKVSQKKEKKPSKYRDRAEERRTDTNKDYEKDDNIAALEVDAEASKYLGGDVAHTHLVRGLDRALLEKTRTDLSKAMPPPAPISRPKAVVKQATPLARAALSCFEPAARSATASRRVRAESRSYDFAGLSAPSKYDAPPTTIVRSAADRSQLFDDEASAPRVSAEVVACAVAALSRKGSRKRKKASEKAVPVTTAAPVVMGDDEDIFAGAGHYVKTEGSLAERAAASRRAAAEADEDAGDAAQAAQYLPQKPSKPPPAQKAQDSDDEFEEAARRDEAEPVVVVEKPKEKGNRKERRKAKQVVHRDPIWGGAVPAPKKQALSRNFDGSADAYGEVTMYDSDDETYAMKKQREAAADAEAAYYRQKGKKRRKKGDDDDEGE